VHAASDCFLNYSPIGETFGLALAEAIADGVVPIVNSTPNGDNAQVELCRHGETGLIANSVSALATAIDRVGQGATLRERLREQGTAHVTTFFAENVVELRLRRFVRRRLTDVGAHRTAVGVPIPAAEPDGYEITTTWIQQFRRDESRATNSRAPIIVRAFDSASVSVLSARDLASYARAAGVRRSILRLHRALAQRGRSAITGSGQS
jgi:hypothetical protein